MKSMARPQRLLVLGLPLLLLLASLAAAQEQETAPDIDVCSSSSFDSSGAIFNYEYLVHCTPLQHSLALARTLMIVVLMLLLYLLSSTADIFFCPVLQVQVSGRLSRSLGHSCSVCLIDDSGEVRDPAQCGWRDLLELRQWLARRVLQHCGLHVVHTHDWHDIHSGRRTAGNHRYRDSFYAVRSMRLVFTSVLQSWSHVSG